MNNMNIKDELINSEIPFISVMNELHIEIFSNKKLIIDGSCSVLEYQSSLICLSFKKGSLTIIGDSLTIISISDEGVRITGDIFTMSFERQ